VITITSKGYIARKGKAVGYIQGEVIWLYEPLSGRDEKTVKEITGLHFIMYSGQLKKGVGLRA
jgi:hypothetical protein